VLRLEELLAGETRYRAVSGLYRNTRQEDFFWFAFRAPHCWAELDAETRSNGAFHIEVDDERWGVLVADGAVVMKCLAGEPGYRRLHAMVDPRLRRPSPMTPVAVERGEWEGREAVTCRWDDHPPGKALFDVASGLVVRTETADEVVELSEIQFDDAVAADAFVPPEKTVDGWRGGTAYVQHDTRSGLCSVSWRAASGPGSLHVLGPDGISLEMATDWSQIRTDDVRVSEIRRR
jgi:hypothetical protein